MRLSPALLLAYIYSASFSTGLRTEAGQQDQAPLVTVCRPGVGWGFFGWGVFPEEIVAAEGGWRLISSNLPRDREKQHPAD